MSQLMLQSMYEAFNRREFAETVDCFHPEAEVYPAVVGFDTARPGRRGPSSPGS